MLTRCLRQLASPNPQAGDASIIIDGRDVVDVAQGGRTLSRSTNPPAVRARGTFRFRLPLVKGDLFPLEGAEAFLPGSFTWACDEV